MQSAHPLHAAGRALAVLGAAALGALSFALPAEAQTDDAEVGAEAEYPFLLGGVAYEDAEPGDTVDVAPQYLQELELPIDAAAIAVIVSNPQDQHRGGGVEAIADYDNCVDTNWGEPTGVTCLVTDFEDLPGTVFTFADPITFAIPEDAPGPVEVCGCVYDVRAIDIEELDRDYGGEFWDPNSDDLFELEAAEDPGTEFPTRFEGPITIETAANSYDLTVEDVNAKGAKGDRVSLSVPVGNEGPASANEFVHGVGSYAVLGELPEGLDLHEIESDLGNGGELLCLDPEDWDDALPGVDTADLDFACVFDSLPAGESFSFEFSVDIADPASKDVGRLEVQALEAEDYPADLDADLGNNTADITVNAVADPSPTPTPSASTSASSTPKLPKTGTSMPLFFGVAALILLGGGVLVVLAARRRELRIGG